MICVYIQARGLLPLISPRTAEDRSTDPEVPFELLVVGRTLEHRSLTCAGHVEALCKSKVAMQCWKLSYLEMNCLLYKSCHKLSLSQTTVVFDCQDRVWEVMMRLWNHLRSKVIASMFSCLPKACCCRSGQTGHVVDVCAHLALIELVLFKLTWLLVSKTRWMIIVFPMCWCLKTSRFRRLISASNMSGHGWIWNYFKEISGRCS